MAIIKFIRGSWKDILIGLFIIAIAAFLSASMDTIDHHYPESVFKDLPEYFFHDWTRLYEKDPDGNLIRPLIRKAWDFGFIKINIHPIFFDAWHLAKTLLIFMIILYGATFVFARERFVFYWKNLDHWMILIFLIVLYGFIWNLVFNLFYDSILLAS